MRLRRNPLVRTFQRVSVFQRGRRGLAVVLVLFLEHVSCTRFAFQTCEKLTRLFKVQGQSLSGHAVCLYNLFVPHTLP